MRRTRATLIALTFAALLLPSVSRAASVPVKFQVITFSGEATFDDKSVSTYPGPFPEAGTYTSTQNEDFNWVIVKQRQFRSDGTHRTTTLYDAQGVYNSHIEGVEPPDASCSYSVDPTPVVENSRIARAKPDPQVLVDWVLPTPSGIFQGEGPGCNGRNPLNYRALNFDFQPTPDYNEAILGSEYTTLSKLPYSRSLGDTLSGDYADTYTNEHASTTIKAKVTSFALGEDFSLKKLRDLVRDDALNIVGMITNRGSSVGQGRPQQTLIIPHPEPGKVRVKVLGQDFEVPIGRVRGRAAATTLLASASHKVKAGKAFRLKLTPTAKAAAFLSRPHDALPISVKVSFDPKGKRHAVSATRAGALPSRAAP